MRTHALLLALLSALCQAQPVSDLHARGYTLLPAPQQVAFEGGDFELAGPWALEAGPGAEAAPAALDTLRTELAERFHFSFAPSAPRRVRLTIAPASVAEGESLDRDRAAIATQAYRLTLRPDLIEIAANAPAGLFYGAATLVQLVRPSGGRLWLPRAAITDWPDLRLRTIYWDCAHHLERLDELKRAVRQAALYKINGFAIKFEGHFQFRSAPAVVEPQALTPAEFQELTDYGLRHFVQVIPWLDAPAHIAFILKHAEYAHLRAFPNNNYELCVVDPESVKLVEGMFQELIDANRGVGYAHLSTDEPYYVGMAERAGCREKTALAAAGSPGKLLARYVGEVADYLHRQGRTVLFWGEYPMKPADIPALPAHMVNGETNGRAWDRAWRAHGIRQTIYVPTQGEERLFPDYFALDPGRRLHAREAVRPRVEEAFGKISHDTARQDSDVIGAVVAAWGDAGLHPETFWLGYTAIASAAWKPASPGAREAAAAFYPLFYGHETVRMDRVYQLMSTGAQAWWDLWDIVPSTLRKPIVGNSEGMFDKPRPEEDQTLPLPPAPDDKLGVASGWRAANARRIALAAAAIAESDELLGLLDENLRRASRNRYNLEVFLAVAGLVRQGFEMVVDIGAMEASLSEAARSAARPRRAVGALDRALDIAEGIRARRNEAYRDAVAAWYKSWLPRVAEANGRHFLHELDDVKDHVPDRTVDMSYLVYRERNLAFGEWVERIRAVRNRFAQAHGMPAAEKRFDWKDLEAR
jgi:hexosaminidase